MFFFSTPSSPNYYGHLFSHAFLCCSISWLVPSPTKRMTRSSRTWRQFSGQVLLNSFAFLNIIEAHHQGPSEIITLISTPIILSDGMQLTHSLISVNIVPFRSRNQSVSGTFAWEFHMRLTDSYKNHQIYYRQNVVLWHLVSKTVDLFVFFLKGIYFPIQESPTLDSYFTQFAYYAVSFTTSIWCIFGNLNHISGA